MIKQHSVEVFVPKGAQIEKPTGVVRGARKIGAAVVKSESVRTSAKNSKNHLGEAGKVAKGIGTEVMHDPRVRESMKKYGSTILRESGILNEFDAIFKRPKTNVWGTREKGYRDVLRQGGVAARKEAPSLRKEVIAALPGSIHAYESKNPGALRHGVRELGSAVREGSRATIEATKVGYQTARDIRAENKEINARNQEAFRVGNEIMQAHRNGTEVTVLKTVTGDTAVVPSQLRNLTPVANVIAQPIGYASPYAHQEAVVHPFPSPNVATPHTKAA